MINQYQVYRKNGEIYFANECVPQSSLLLTNLNKNDGIQLTHSLGFGSSNIEG